MRSIIASLDISSGLETVHLDTRRHLEAPNWSTDGKSLIVNGEGLLFRLDLETGSLQKIYTGFADKLNNDHGLSPDGRFLAISDASRTGESCIYTVPAGGGEPARVTEEVPSYWHGWSPDGLLLAYVGKRDDTFQVFTCPVSGGSETRVTRDFDHCDGPDYSPDGNWIWFNGERKGSVQLWKVRPDGSGLQQMTDDDRVNWFPHPSPDGKSVVYLAYEPGTRGHPALRNVELRMMPAEGGEPATLAGFCGGQGTINVPSWAPDSGKFAFVRLRPE